MEIDELRKAKNERPFAPFRIRMADGHEVEIRHPDAVAWDEEDDPRVALALSGGERHTIELALITALVAGRTPGNRKKKKN